LLGANPFQQDDVEKNWTIRDDATLRHGPHTFKAGGQIVFYDLSRIEAANTNGTFFVANRNALCRPDQHQPGAGPHGQRHADRTLRFG
jgi:hypothetical protein